MDIYDSERRPTGRTHVRGVPVPKGDYHLVIRAWVMRNDGKILLSKRHPDKPYGNYWECTGGAVAAGEDTLTGAIREVREEVGLTVDREHAVLLQTGRGNECFFDIYLFQQDIQDEVVYQPEEVIDAKWVNRSEYEEMERAGLIIPGMTPLYEYIDFFK